MGDYKLIASLPSLTNATETLTMKLRVKGKPIVSLTGERQNSSYYPANERHTFRCNVKSFPMQNTTVKTHFQRCTTMIHDGDLAKDGRGLCGYGAKKEDSAFTR